MTKRGARKYYSFKKVLRELKLNEERLKEIVSQGGLRAYRDNNEIKFDRMDVKRYKTQIQQRNKLKAQEDVPGDDPNKVSQIIEDEQLFETTDSSFDSVFYSPRDLVSRSTKETPAASPAPSEESEEPEETSCEIVPDDLAEQLEAPELLDEPEEENRYVDMEESFVEHFDEDDMQLEDEVQLDEAAVQLDDEVQVDEVQLNEDDVQLDEDAVQLDDDEDSGEFELGAATKNELKAGSQVRQSHHASHSSTRPAAMAAAPAPESSGGLSLVSKLLGSVIAMGLLAAAIYWVLRLPPASRLLSVRVARIQPGDLVTKVMADGVVVPRRRVLVVSTVPGIVERIFRKAGEVVKHNPADILIKLKSAQIAQRLERCQMQVQRCRHLWQQAKIELHLARRTFHEMVLRQGRFAHRHQSAKEKVEKEIAQAQGALAKLRQKLTKAEKERERKRVLLASGVISRSDYQRFVEQVASLQAATDKARLRWEQANERLNACLAREPLSHQRYQNQVRLAEIQSALRHLELQQASYELQKARMAEEQLWIKTPLDGVITQVDVSVGDQVSAGPSNPQNALMVIEDTSQFYVQANIKSADILKVRKHQLAIVTFRALPNRIFNGRVKSVAYSATAGKQGSYFPVRISLDTKIPLFRSGLAARVAIITATEQNVLRIPMAAVVSCPGSQPTSEVVYRVVEQGQQTLLEEVPVRLGKRNDTFAAVLQGLHKDDRVVIGPVAIFKYLHHGLAVRVASES